MNKLQKKITDFWEWFYDNMILFNPENFSSDIVRQLELQLEQVNVITWEIGPAPNDNAKYYFAIPFSGDPEYDLHVKRIIQNAKFINEWAFFAGLPKKKWNRKVLWGSTGELIDVSQWCFQLVRNEKGLYDVTFITEGIILTKKDDIYILVENVIQHELGQVFMNKWIYSIDVHFVDDINRVANLIPIDIFYDTLGKKIKYKT